jgi:hypothetical protein
MPGLETHQQFPLRAKPTFFNVSDADPFREKHFVTKSILKYERVIEPSINLARCHG